jgi:membrane-associated phospholipid phosphatase
MVPDQTLRAVVDDGRQVAVPLRRANLRTIRIGALCVWVVALTLKSWRTGIPFDRPQQTLWILGGIVAATAGSNWRRVARIFVDWVPWIGLLLIYDVTRGFADQLGIPVHVARPLAIDQALGGGQIPTVWLQDHLYDSSRLHWWDVAASLVYVSHFVAAWAIAAVLYVRNRDRWAAFARRLLLLSYAGLATYILYPAAPPWYAAKEGLVAPVDRFSAQGFRAIGLDNAEPFIKQGQAAVNSVAAVPSLHAAFAFLICLFFWQSSSVPVRVVLAAYPLAMGFSLVYTGEHYVIDVILGALYAILALVAVHRAEHWHRARTSLRGDARPT